MRLFRKKKHVVKKPEKCKNCGSLDTVYKQTMTHCNSCGSYYIVLKNDYKIKFDKKESRK